MTRGRILVRPYRARLSICINPAAIRPAAGRSITSRVTWRSDAAAICEIVTMLQIKLNKAN